MRHSGIELLRVISIFFILVVHVINLVIGAPDRTDLLTKPLSAITTISFESIAVVCVDVFVIISGWFGIKYSIKGLLKLIFQCVFFYIIEIIIGVIFFEFPTHHYIKGFISSFFIGWFISAYIMLFILSPIINEFISLRNKKKCDAIIIPTIIFLLAYGWLVPSSTGNISTFSSGYSALFLLVLYFLVRYYKIFYYQQLNLKVNCRNYIYIYIVTTVVNIILWIFFTEINVQYISSIIFLYTSPIVILQSYALFKTFSTFSFKSKFINKIGASALSIMLFHFCCGGIIFKRIVSQIYSEYASFSCLIRIFAFLITISIVALILDQIRILIWNNIENRFLPLIDKQK